MVSIHWSLSILAQKDHEEASDVTKSDPRQRHLGRWHTVFVDEEMLVFIGLPYCVNKILQASFRFSCSYSVMQECSEVLQYSKTVL